MIRLMKDISSFIKIIVKFGDREAEKDTQKTMDLDKDEINIDLIEEMDQEYLKILVSIGINEVVGFDDSFITKYHWIQYGVI